MSNHRYQNMLVFEMPRKQRKKEREKARKKMRVRKRKRKPADPSDQLLDYYLRIGINYPTSFGKVL